MPDAEIAWLGASELGRRIARREFTARQVTEIYLARIAAIDGEL